MPTAANPHSSRDQMTSDTGAIRFASLAILIIVTGLLFLNYLSS
jgi:hypothetical protein